MEKKKKNTKKLFRKKVLSYSVNGKWFWIKYDDLTNIDETFKYVFI